MRTQISPTPSATDEVVIDTNVVLDWLVFGDAAAQGLANAIEERLLRWVATPAMLSELERVLSRIGGATEHVLGRARHSSWLVTTVEPPTPAAAALRCCDADDQMYIDLAVARRTRFLLTRDKALLALARAAGRFDVTVCRPVDVDWTVEEQRAAEAARRSHQHMADRGSVR